MWVDDMQTAKVDLQKDTPLKSIYTRQSIAARRLYSQDVAEIPEYIKKIFFKTLPDVVVQPTTVDALIQIIKDARNKNKIVIPRGSASYGFGGIIPAMGGIIVDLSHLNKIIEFDEFNEVIIVESGIKWYQLDIYLNERGYTVRTHPSSWFSTVGGWLATGGYGFYNYKFGHFSEDVVFIDVIDADGKIERISHDDKRFRNYVGTEGQMGIVVRLGIKVRKLPKREYISMAYFDSIPELLDALENIVNSNVASKITNIMIYDAHKMHIMNIIRGKKILTEKNALIITTESDNDFKNVNQILSENNGQLSSEYEALYVWHERLFTFKPKRIKTGYLASEHIFPISKLKNYFVALEKVKRRYNREFSVQAYLVSSKEALVIVSYLTNPRRRIASIIDFLLVVYLTKLGIKYGGKLYGIGIWNNGLKFHKYSKEEFKKLWEYKQKIDPDYIFNRGKFFKLKTRLLGLPGLIFKPRIFTISSVFIGPLMILLKLFEGSDKTDVIEHKKISIKDIERIAYMCSNCGSCVSVCPGYLYTKNELSTARGKLFLIRNFGSLKNKLTHEDIVSVFSCLYCKNCEAVCQSELPLVDIWPILEERLEKIYGRPKDEIEEFVRTMEYSETYSGFLEQSPNTFKVEKFNLVEKV